MKPFATVLNAGTSLSNHTGSWRTERPKYVHRLPPCNNACPAGENIQEWLSLLDQERHQDAWLEIVKNNPFPAVMGRICYHPCEKACNRVILEGAVGINSVERFLGDMAISKKWGFEKPKKASKKNVLVIGAGPAGLSAAYHLTKLGHKVTVKEAMKKAGGMMRYGIPQYRLPRKILDAEIRRIVDYGVELKTGAKVPSLSKIMASEAYDAVFLSAGAPLAKGISFATGPRARVLDAVAVLRDMEGREKPRLGKRVVVYGGGNTAMDVARTAKRLGAKEVTIVYRRTREKMPAHAFEIEDALQEGVDIRFLVTIEKYKDKKLTLEKMRLDKKGFPQPTGKKEKLDADCVILALGQDVDKALFEDVPGVVFEDGALKVDGRFMTGASGVFAAGDMVSSVRTATTAIGQGKKAARSIDAWLSGVECLVPEKNPLATAERLNKWYYAEASRTERETMPPDVRKKSFDEAQKGLSAEDALAEARRCLSCGNCFECDNCYAVCPDNAIKKLGTGKGFAIDYDYCKGCGLCAAECPCGAIEMELEKI